MSEIKITPIKVVTLWNAIGDTELINENLSPEFTLWVKRFRVNAKPEIEFWNDLTVEERELIIDEEIDFSIKKLNIDHAPKNIPAQHRGMLQEFINGELPEQKSKLQKLLEGKKNESNT